MAKEVELLGVGFFVDDKRGFFGGQTGALGVGLCSAGTKVIEPAVGVEDGELAGGTEKGLMIVRAVNIDEAFAERGKNREGGGRAVNELAAGAGGGEGT